MSRIGAKRRPKPARVCDVCRRADDHQHGSVETHGMALSMRQSWRAKAAAAKREGPLDCELDEIFAHGAALHLERMDTNAWFLWIETDRASVHMYLPSGRVNEFVALSPWDALAKKVTRRWRALTRRWRR